VLDSGFSSSRCDSTICQTFPTNYLVDDVFTSTWNDCSSSTLSSLPPGRNYQPADVFQPARQLTVCFDDVISGRQRPNCCGGNSGGVGLYPSTWSEAGPRPFYGRNSICVSSYPMTTCNSTPSLAVSPRSSSFWAARQQPEAGYSYRACAEYHRTSRSHHVVSDVAYTSGSCGWNDWCDLDETIWPGKFATPLLEGL